MSKPICPHCEADNCYAHCYDAADGIHRPERRTIHGNDGYDIEAEGGIVVDINCTACGQSGAILITLASINWG